MGKGWLAVEKPAGMTVHNQPGQDLCAIVSGIMDDDESVRNRVQPDSNFGIHPVHRLDKETSGLMLLAADPEMFTFFSKQFESHKVKKRYIALLHGLLEIPNKNQSWGNWQWSLTKTAGGRNNPRGSGKRQPADSRYRIITHSARYTLVDIEPLTGRKHQIRRHAKLAGHPVVGDVRYGTTRAANFLRDRFSFTRLGLHSKSLTLQLPGQQNPATIETPDIPSEIKELFDRDTPLS